LAPRIREANSSLPIVEYRRLLDERTESQRLEDIAVVDTIGVQIIKVPASSLVGTQRLVDQSKVEIFKEQIRKNEFRKFVKVVKVGNKNVVNDGHHRIEAFLQLGFVDVPVVYQGNPGYEKTSLPWVDSRQTTKSILLDVSKLREMKSTEPFEVSISSLVVGQTLVSEPILKQYMKLISDGSPIEPVDVIKFGDKYFVQDGNHRVEAAFRLGKKTILAKYWDSIIQWKSFMES
jgi:uncharacterized ParB-like nuclease family protein